MESGTINVIVYAFKKDGKKRWMRKKKGKGPYDNFVLCIILDVISVFKQVTKTKSKRQKNKNIKKTKRIPSIRNISFHINSSNVSSFLFLFFLYY